MDENMKLSGCVGVGGVGSGVGVGEHVCWRKVSDGKTAEACRVCFFIGMDFVWYSIWNSLRVRMWILV